MMASRPLGVAAAPASNVRDLAGKAGIYRDQPAKILEVETQDDPRRVVRQVMPAIVCPQISVKVVGGPGTSWNLTKHRHLVILSPCFL